MGHGSSAQRFAWPDHSPSRFFAVARHAERADDMGTLVSGEPWALTPESWRWPLDPPLCDVGIAHAQRMGHSFANASIAQGSSVHVVISSPYLRCIQTAAEICKQLSPKCKLLIDSSLGEVFGPTIMGDIEPSCTVRPLEETLLGIKERGIQVVFKPVGKPPQWPETLRQARERFALRFIQYVYRSKALRRNFIIVSHADCVGAALSCMRSSKGWLAAHSIKHGGYFLAKRTAVHPTNEGNQSSADSQLPSNGGSPQSLASTPSTKLIRCLSEEDFETSLGEDQVSGASSSWKSLSSDWILEVDGIETRTRKTRTVLSGIDNVLASVHSSFEKGAHLLFSRLSAKERCTEVVDLLRSLPAESLHKGEDAPTRRLVQSVSSQTSTPAPRKDLSLSGWDDEEPSMELHSPGPTAAIDLENWSQVASPKETPPSAIHISRWKDGNLDLPGAQQEDKEPHSGKKPLDC